MYFCYQKKKKKISISSHNTLRQVTQDQISSLFLCVDKLHFYTENKYESLVKTKARFWRSSCTVSTEVLFFTDSYYTR